MGKFFIDKEDEIGFKSDNDVIYRFEDARTVRRGAYHDKSYMLLDEMFLYNAEDESPYDTDIDVVRIVYDLIGGNGLDTIVSTCYGSGDNFAAVEKKLTGSCGVDNSLTRDPKICNQIYEDFLRICDRDAYAFEKRHPEIVELYKDPVEFFDQYLEFEDVDI